MADIPLVDTVGSSASKDIFVLSIVTKNIIARSYTHAEELNKFLTKYDFSDVAKIYEIICKICDEFKCDCNNIDSTSSSSSSSSSASSSSSSAPPCKCKKYNNARELVLRDLTRRWQEVKSEKDIDVIKNNYRLVKDFLKTEDFSHSSATNKHGLDLENFLAKMVYIHYKSKNKNNSHKESDSDDDLFFERYDSNKSQQEPQEPQEPREQFEDLFDLIRFESVQFETFALLCTLERCKTASPEFIEKLTKIANDIMVRSDSKKSTRFLNNIEEGGIRFEDIKVNEVYDVKETNGYWCVGKVKKISNDEIVMSLFGWGDTCNQKFTEKSYIGNIAKYATRSNGIKHSSVGQCSCTICTV